MIRFLGEWTWEPGVVFGVMAAAVWYGAGVRRLWRRAGISRGVTSRHAMSFAAGLLAVLIALLSPIDVAAETSFAAHMTQHLVLIAVAAPLLVLGRPLLPSIWGLPLSWRRHGGRWWTANPTLRRVLAIATLPGVAWVAHAATLGFWHIPIAYGWAWRHAPVHVIEHATFLLTGCLFWWAILQPAGRRRLGYGAAILYVSAFAGVMGIFAAVLTFARTPWYAADAQRIGVSSLSALEDQQLAGLIMWIPGSLVYLAATAFCFVQWLAADARVPRHAAQRPRGTHETAYVARSAIP